MRDLIEAFAVQAARVGATVHRTAPAEGVPRIANVLAETSCRTAALASGLPNRATILEALRAEDVSEVAAAQLSPIRRADCGVSWAKLGVAESGSVLLHASSEDRRVELCVDVHVVWLAASALVPTLDEAFAALREISARPPAYVSLVSGPSSSADIERILTVGVHGPKALHIVLIGDAE